MFNLSNSVCGIRCPVITSLIFYVWILDKLFYTFCVINVCSFKFSQTMVKVIGTFVSKIVLEWCVSRIASQIFGGFFCTDQGLFLLVCFQVSFTWESCVYQAFQSLTAECKTRPEGLMYCSLYYMIWLLEMSSF